MILHIAPDEKFIDFAFTEFQKVCSNKLLILTDNVEEDFKYINNGDVTKVSPYELLTPVFIKKLSNYEFVVLHQLEQYKALLVLKAYKNVDFVWLGWGFDYYTYIVDDRRKLLLTKTKKLWIKNNSFTNLKYFLKKLIRYRNAQDKALNYIKYFAPVLPSEFDIVHEFIGEYVPFSYTNLSEISLGLNLKCAQGVNILLGNSSSYANNHLEAIDILSRFDLKGRKIITPLSYGDMQYKENIKKYGFLKLDKNFMPLDNFMNKSEYHKLISSCSIIVMNHLRQQGLGNIISMMFMGAKIYLDSRNLIFNFFKNKGAYIYDIKTLITKNKSALIPLSDSEITINRQILQDNWGDEVVNQKIIDLVQKVRGIE